MFKRKDGLPVHILELQLSVDTHNNHILDGFCNVSQKLYNTLLSDVIPKVNELKKDSRLTKILRANKNLDESQLAKKAASLIKEYGFSKNQLETLAKNIRNNPVYLWANKLASPIVQKIAGKLSSAINKYLFGTSKTLNFIAKGNCNSFENKQIGVGINFKYSFNSELNKFEGFVQVNDCLTNKKYAIPVKFRVNDKYTKHALETGNLSYIRIVRKFIRGKVKWFAQIVYGGYPYIKEHHKPTEKTIDQNICVDLNVRTAAVVGDKGTALIYPFENVVEPDTDKKIKKLQRQMERSRRANNPNMYHPDTKVKSSTGKPDRIKKGKVLTHDEREVIVLDNQNGKAYKNTRRFKNSKTYENTQRQFREANRKRAAKNKCTHRHTINLITTQSINCKAEDISGKGWAKNYGESVNSTGQFFFYRELERKIILHGGKFELVNTFETCLSQLHSDGTKQAKGLNIRVHKDVNPNIVMQRDLFSAFMGLFSNTKTVVKKVKGKDKEVIEWYVDIPPNIEEIFHSLETNMKVAWRFWEEVKDGLWDKLRPKSKKQARSAIRKALKAKKLKAQHSDQFNFEVPEKFI